MSFTLKTFLGKGGKKLQERTQGNTKSGFAPLATLREHLFNAQHNGIG